MSVSVCLCVQFNDVLLLCKSLPLNIGQHQQYHVKSVLEVDGMEVMYHTASRKSYMRNRLIRK